MHIDFLVERFARARDEVAIVWRGESFTYAWLADRIDYWDELCEHYELLAGHVVALEADFSPDGVACLLALIHCGLLVGLDHAANPESEDSTSDEGDNSEEEEDEPDVLLKEAGAILVDAMQLKKQAFALSMKERN